MSDDAFAGLAAARVVFARSRNREEHEWVAVRLRLSLLPYDVRQFPELAGTKFGMQDSGGRLLIPREEGAGRMVFDVGVLARRNRLTGAVSFLGPYAHGPAGDQFLYLNWRKPEMPGEWVWRRKFRLTSLAWEELVAADAAGETFAFDGTGRPGHNTAPVDWKRERG